MNAIRLNNRLKKLEQKLSPPDDGMFTLEEMCRAMWEENKSDFLKLARGMSLGYFIAQLEREDEDRQQSACPRRRQSGRPIIRIIWLRCRSASDDALVKIRRA
jgi:hypothetical protein